VQNSKHIKELLAGGGKRLADIARLSRERSVVLDEVRSALPKELAQAVFSAGILEGKLTLGVTSAAFASRLRYVTQELRQRLGEARGIDIRAVRIRVVPPGS
jgi:hypothetical protein